MEIELTRVGSGVEELCESCGVLVELLDRFRGGVELSDLGTRMCGAGLLRRE